jgi:excisionase family DNA binding protein
MDNMNTLSRTGHPDELLTPHQVAALFAVNPKTITRWAKAGKIAHVRTLGGHRRYRRKEVVDLLRQGESPRAA